MATITVAVQGLGEFDGTFAYPVGTPYIPLLRFVGEQAGGAAPWRTLAQAVLISLPRWPGQKASKKNRCFISSTKTAR